MGNDSIQAQVDRIIELSHRLQAAVAAGELDEATVLLAERGKIVGSLADATAAGLTREEAEQLVEGLREAIDLDERQCASLTAMMGGLAKALSAETDSASVSPSYGPEGQGANPRHHSDRWA